MTSKIKLDDDAISLFQRHGSVVNTADGKTYYFLPYWLECHTDDEFTFVMHHLGDLPPGLIEKITEERS